MTPERGLLAAGRAPLYAALFIVATLNAVHVALVESIRTEGWGSAAAGFFSVSAFIWIALLAIAQLAIDEPPQPLAKRDRLVLAAGLALCFLPTGWEARLALLGGSLYLWRTSAPRTPERRIAIVAASLTVPLIWGRLALILLAPELLHVDAALVGLLTGHEVQGNTVTFAPSAMADAGKRVMIMVGCSSFTNISLTAVVTALVTQLCDIPIRWRLLTFAAALALAAFAINLLRLAALAMLPDRFDWLHVGLGATLFAYAGLLAMGIIALAATRSTWLRARA